MRVNRTGDENVGAVAGQTERLISDSIAFEIIAIDRE